MSDNFNVDGFCEILKRATEENKAYLEEEQVQCPQCQTEISQTVKICPVCGFRREP